MNSGNTRLATIPFLDLRHSIDDMRPQLDAAYDRVVTRGNLILGPELEAFEQEFAATCGVSHAVGAGCGLDALVLILKGLGLGPGDEIIVPANTYIATWLAISAVGARIVPVEPDPLTYNIDPAAADAAVGPRTAAILAVHLYGHCADMTSLARLAGRRGLALLVDAAQAIGARHRNRADGIIGDAAGFSFYPTKNVGALGDGGAVVTAHRELAEKVRKLRNYGGTRKNQHDLKGVNSRLDELQAAFLRCRLARLHVWNERRRELASRYIAGLNGLTELTLPMTNPDAYDVWHLFTIAIGGNRRDDLRKHLRAAGIETGIYYPTPPHLSGAYRDEQFGPLPVTERLARSILNLPLHPYLNNQDVDRICERVHAWHASL